MSKMKRRSYDDLSDEEKKKRARRFIIMPGDVTVEDPKDTPREHWQLFRGRALFFLLDIKGKDEHLPVRASPFGLATAIRVKSPKAWAKFIEEFPEYPLSINKSNYPEGYPD